MQIKITVIKRGTTHYATRTFTDNMPDFNPPGLIFSMTEEVTPEGLEGFEEKVKQKARELGLKRVINLY